MSVGVDDDLGFEFEEDLFQGTNTIIVAAFTMATALLLLSLCGGVSAATPVLTVHSSDGDVIDCVKKMDQPSLTNPLLKNHSFQDYPSGMTKTEEGGFGWQVWHRNGTACPHGTVPVQRVEAEAELSQGKYGPLIPDAAERATKGHQYAVGFVEADLPIYGTRATLNVWNPVVESGDDFSLAQIWVTSGNYKNNDLNTIETGWQVYPNKYGDRQARLFTYWTIDAYISSGCYNHYCKGFVHVNRHVVLGGAIIGTSTFGGDQFDITLQIWKITNDSVRSIALLPKLEVLDMYLEKWLSFTTRNICDNIKPLKHLKTLWIDGARVSDSSLLTLTSSCRALPELGVSRCVGVTDGGMGLARNCSNLKALNLACCGFATDAAISAVVQSCLNLDVTPSVFESSILLTVMALMIRDKGIFHIGSKCSKLLELDLYRCAGFGDDGLAAISRGCKSLNLLILSYCGELTDAGVEKIHLSHLELRGIKNITGTGLAAITRGCKKLAYLDSSYVRISMTQASGRLRTCQET
ncbi:hypothetical protein Bca52824_062350 [Brassica carinata]|uniref:Neprosin PEP catalytic domain-containing protein n=1 Tax=Brassica carinata TaxID=52824 RepID=A0A8X7U696_BRACI|nr:hypothetical protein Bca52824_062350 [Brassica carinata]